MSSLGIIIDGFYIDCLAPGNVINDRRHDEPPFFFFLSPVWQIRSVNVAYSSTARYSSSNFEAGLSEHKGSVEIFSNTILRKSRTLFTFYFENTIGKVLGI